MFLCLDTETTAINPLDGDLLQIAFIICDMKLDVVAKDNYFFNAKKWERSTKKFHKDNGYLPEWQAAYKSNLVTFENAISKYGQLTLVGVNAHFDYHWLKAKMPNITNVISHRLLDLPTLYYQPEIDGFALPSSSKIYERAGIVVDLNKKHRADYDTNCVWLSLRAKLLK